jgi:hypothetical protein
MKKIIAFTVGTIAVVATAIGVQAFATSGHDEAKQPPAASSTESPSLSDSSATATPPDGSTSGTTDGATKEDDGEREGFTEDQEGKPGENK